MRYIHAISPPSLRRTCFAAVPLLLRAEAQEQHSNYETATGKDRASCLQNALLPVKTLSGKYGKFA